MSRDIHEAFINAALSAASYSRDLRSGVTGGELRDALDGELTEPLSEYVAASFDVIAQYPIKTRIIDAESGFSVTVFRERSSGQLYVSFRGTDGFSPQDLLADIDLALISGVAYQQVRAMVNWFMRASTPSGQQALQVGDRFIDGNGQWQLRTFTQPGTGELAGSTGFIVNGHSLGGHLATAFARLFAPWVVASYTYNSAGFQDRSETVFGMFERALGIGTTTFPGARQTNFFAENGLNVTTSDEWTNQFGQRVPVFNEEGRGISNHSMYKLTDALALFDVMGVIDPQLTLSEANAIADAGSMVERASLERLLDSLRRLFLGAVVPTQVGDNGDAIGGMQPAYRTDYHARIAELRSSLAEAGIAAYRISPLTDLSAELLASVARGDDGVAFRYALKDLNPFAVVGDNGRLYGGRDLGVYDELTGEGALTEEWIRDRADFLSWKIRNNTSDRPLFGANTVSSSSTWYNDVASRESAYVVPVDIALGLGGIRNSQRIEALLGFKLHAQRVFFGAADGDDALYGDTDNDSLYGDAGDDYLSGLAGDDYLQGDDGDDHLRGGAGADRLSGGRGADAVDGGLGDDTYIWNIGDGFDTIVDQREGGDGPKRGTILFLGRTLAGAKTQVDPDEPRIFQDERGLRYELTGAPDGGAILTVTKPGEDGGLQIVDFEAGDFGIDIPVPQSVQQAEKFGTQDPDTNLAFLPNYKPALYADAEYQTVYGLDGADSLYLDYNHTTGYGGPGHDVVADSSGEQSLYGDEGNDILIASSGPDFLDGGADDDALQGGADDDELHGFMGNDLVDGGMGADVIFGGEGSDFIFGGGNLTMDVADWRAMAEGELEFLTVTTSGSLRLPALTGADPEHAMIFEVGYAVVEGDEADMIDGGPGNDAVYAGDGNDYIEGGDGDDYIVGQVHDDAVYGDGGDDRLYGDGAQGDLVQGDEHYWIYAFPEFHGHDYLDGGDGDDFISGDGGSDELIGGLGDDTLVGDSSNVPADYHGADYLDGGEGDDRLIGYGGDDALFGGAGNDRLSGDSDTTAPYAHGNDFLEGEDGNDHMTGSGGNDTLFGGDGVDFLLGDADDVPFLNHGADYLDGEGGDDYLRGYEGNDILYGGDGFDEMLGEGGDDFLDGEAGNDLVAGGDDDDVLFGGAGIDDLQGGDGEDFLDGEDDDDQLNGEDGNDRLFGNVGDDQLVGGGGDDDLDGGVGDDRMWGDSGDDTLSGGAGRDVLMGGRGRDTYVFTRGDGVDHIQDVPELEDASDASVLVLHGYSPDDVVLRQGSLMIDLGDGDAVHFYGFDPDHPYSTRVLDHLQFDDGFILTYEDLLARGFEAEGTDGADLIVGTAVTDRAHPSAGNDIVSGGDGDDELQGGEGNDVLSGGAGVDALSGGTGNDDLHGGPADDTLSGDDGDDALAGDAGADILLGGEGEDQLTGGDGEDSLYGGAGADRLTAGRGADSIEGGEGDDLLTGNLGSDTYVFESGDGQDVINDAGMVAIGIVDDGVDVVRFGDGVGPSDVTFLRRGNGDLIVQYGEAGEITVRGQYSRPGNAIERIEFATGETIGEEELLALEIAPVVGSPGDDRLYGTTGDDLLIGLDGDDILDGGPAPEDTVPGNALSGDDVLDGGAGADTYVMRIGMGSDTIVDSSTAAEDVSTIALAAGLSLRSLRAERDNDDLLVRLRGRPELARISGFYAQESTPSWRIALADGTFAPLAELIEQSGADDSADPIAAMNDYQESLLAQWTAMSWNARLPTHAYVRIAWSQTFTAYYPGRGQPPTVTASSPTQSRDIGPYGVRIDNEIVPIFPTGTQRTIPLVVETTSDASMIGVSTEPDIAISYETHRIQVSFETGGQPTSATWAAGTGTVNTAYVMTGEGWGRIEMDAPNGDHVLTIANIVDRPVVERITAGASANSIRGALNDDPRHAAIIDAGPGNDFIAGGARDFIFGGEGSDVVQGGNTAYGGDGDDQLEDVAIQYGGAGDDLLIGGSHMDGGAGDDSMSGGNGRTDFVIDPLQAGEDLVEDQDGLTQEEFALAYYESISIVNADEGMAFGGMWSVVGRTGSELRRRARDADIGGMENPYYDDEFLSGNEWPSTVYPTLEELTEVLEDVGLAYEAADIRYIPPLPEVPTLAADDYEALEPYYEAGILVPDRLRFADGITLDDMQVTRMSSSLRMAWGESSSVSVTLPEPDNLIGAGIELFEFADGAAYDITYLLDIATEGGGTPGDDLLQYGAGDDFVQGLAGDDEIEAAAGNDTLSGGPGYDYLTGGDGDDVYLFDSGDEADSIFDDGGHDVVRFGAGVTPADVRVTVSPYGGLHLLLPAEKDRVSIADWRFDGNQVEEVQFADGTVWHPDDVDARVEPLLPTMFTDVLAGADGDDFLDGMAGDDLIFGMGGSDVILGGAGDDDVEAAAPGASFIDAGPGDDYVFGEISGLVIGGEGSDYINRSGDAALIGFNRGDGSDTIYAAAPFTLSLGGDVQLDELTLTEDGDDLILGVGSTDSIRLTRRYEEVPGDWPAITLQHIGGSTVSTFDFRATIDDFNVAGGGHAPLHELLQARATGSYVDSAIGGSLAYEYATAGSVEIESPELIRETVASPEFATTPRAFTPPGGDVVGTDGDDVLDGTAAGDTLSGGPGADVMTGGLGDDTYVFNPGDGVDRISDSGGLDRLSFGPGIVPDMLKLGLGSLLLRIESDDRQDAIHIEGFDPGDAAGSAVIEEFAFHDGRTITYEALLARGFVIDGGSGDDSIVGTSVSDTIDGGAGRDLLRGGAGDDLYRIGRGDGLDTIFDDAGVDAIGFEEGIRPDDISVTAEEGTMTLALRGTDDGVTLTWSRDLGGEIETVRFSDGSIWDGATLLSRVNDAPVVAVPLAPRRTLEDEPFRMQVPSETFTDADEWGSLDYAATLADGRALPAWLQFDAATRTFSGTPTNDDVGDYELRVAATDQDGLSAETGFTLTVSNVNDAPARATGIPPSTAVEDQPFLMVVPQDAFVDPDLGDRLTLQATRSNGSPVPGWLRFDPQTGRFSGTPLNGDVGIDSIRVIATDRDGAAAYADFSVTVSNTNDAPELRRALPDAAAYQNARFEYRLAPETFVDVDAGDRIALSARLADGGPLPAWLRFDPSSGIFTGTPGEAQTGVYDVHISATDAAGESAGDIFRIAVSDASDLNTVQSGTRRSDTLRTGATNDFIQGGDGDDTIDSGAGRDVVYGGAGEDDLSLGYGNDVAFGGSAKDRVRGGYGNDFLVGGAGEDRLDGEAGNDVVIGGAGKDIVSGGAGNNLLIGGAGDSLYGGDGRDIFAFNRRDGKNSVYGGDAGIAGNRDTISLGGISASDIVLRRKGRDLIVAAATGSEESDEANVSVILKDWYEGGSRRTISRLQVIGDRVEVYDFAALVTRFDTFGRGKNDTWRAGAAMPDVLLATSADEAIGGVVAFEYARGRLGAVAISSLHATTGGAAFGETLQRVTNDASETLAAYYALDVERGNEWSHDDDHDDDADDRPQRPERQHAVAGISANAYTSALLAFHLTGSEAEADAEQGYMPGGRSAVIPAVGGAPSEVPAAIHTTRAELLGFSGLPQPIAVAA